MNRVTFANTLEAASEQVDRVVDDDLAVLLRHAAVRIRNGNAITLEPDVDFALAEMSLEFGMSKEELIRKVLSDWVRANYLPEDEDGCGMAATPLPIRH